MNNEKNTDEKSDFLSNLRVSFTGELKAFENRFFAKGNPEHAAIGRITYCHLMLEHHLAKYICELNPGLGDLNSANLGFHNLLKMGLNLALGREFIGLLKPLLKDVNLVRNEVAHNIEVNLECLDSVQRLIAAVKGFKGPFPDLTHQPVLAIEIVTWHAVAALCAGKALYMQQRKVESELSKLQAKMASAYEELANIVYPPELNS